MSAQEQFTTTIDAPSPTSTRRERTGVSNTNLYLVTFIATLFLLLFVSCGIVLRSYILRRRYQRQINFALANGAIITPRTQGSKRKRLGARPRLYETWIAPLYSGGYGSLHDTPDLSQEMDEKLMLELEDKHGALRSAEGTSQGRWCDMLPLTVQTVIVKRRTRDITSLLPPAPPPPPPLPPLGPAVNLSDSPPSPFPVPNIGTSSSIRPLLSIVTPPSNFPPPNHNLQGTATPGTPRSSHPQVQFADQPRPGLVSFPPPPSNGESDRHQSQVRPRQNSLLSMFTPATPVADLSTPRERRNSTGSVLAARERRDSATWRTIVSPNPSLPIPPSSAISVEEEDWANEDDDNRRSGFRSAVGRWIPFSRRRSGPNGATELTETSLGAKKAAGKFRVRTEMLQISVLVEMPSLKTSRLYGDANVVKSAYGSYQCRLQNAGAEACTKTRSPGSTASMESKDADEVVEIPGEGLSDDESDDESDGKFDGDQDPEPLPELVLGVMRLPYRPPTQANADPVASPALPSSPQMSSSPSHVQPLALSSRSCAPPGAMV